MFSVSFFNIISLATSGSKVGHNLIENLADVEGLNTLPAEERGGIPSIPVIDKFGLQVLFK